MCAADSRADASAAPADPLALAPGRVHEVEGCGRHAFALFQAVRHSGPLLWILPAPAAHLPMPRVLPEEVAGQLILIRPGSGTDLLRAVEDSLRSGAVGPGYKIRATAGCPNPKTSDPDNQFPP